MNERNVRPFSKRDEIGYVFGDMAGSFVNLFVDAYVIIPFRKYRYLQNSLKCGAIARD